MSFRCNRWGLTKKPPAGVKFGSFPPPTAQNLLGIIREEQPQKASLTSSLSPAYFVNGFYRQIAQR